MSTPLLTSNPSKFADPPPQRFAALRTWLFSWEIYLILLGATFLRFYRIDTTEFDEDQAHLFRLAYDALHQGLLPVTSNLGSIGNSQPPAMIYFLMIPAALSANPLGGALLVAACATLAVVLTYIFTRRYYGRLTATLAAFLYASASTPIHFGRFIWQPNVMPPFVVLFFFALFVGVVERRKGWLFPALALLALLYQFHEVTLLLSIPLLLAIVLAPGTVRRRDLALGIAACLLIFSPYILLFFITNFADLALLFSFAGKHAHIDTQAITFYLSYLSPYNQSLPQNPVLHKLVRLILQLRLVMLFLLLGAIILISVLVLYSQPQSDTPSDERPLRMLGRWWQAFRADPVRCGLFILLVWQIVPLLAFLRHSIDLHAQYLMMFMPGPFILIGFLGAKLVEWSVQVRAGRKLLRYGILAVFGLVVLAQFVNSTAFMLDVGNGKFSDQHFQLSSLNASQHVLQEADQLAQARHINRVYISTQDNTSAALTYLGEQLHTPVTLFDSTHCLVLPGPASGPAVLLMGPYDSFASALLDRFGTATLVDQPARMGGPPYKLYVVTPPSPQASTAASFASILQPVKASTTPLSVDTNQWLVTRWNVLQSLPTAVRTTYRYDFTTSLPSMAAAQSSCSFSSLRAGDQLLEAVSMGALPRGPLSATLSVHASVSVPYDPQYGPFHLETDTQSVASSTQLLTPDGKTSSSLPVT